MHKGDIYMSSIQSNRHWLPLLLATVVLSLQSAQPVWAGATDIANAPLFTSSDNSVHSNIMFYIDDSGSMGQDNMPDDSPMNNSGTYGYKSYQCNGVAFNPATIYTPPVNYDGSTLAIATYGAAWQSFYNTNITTVANTSKFNLGATAPYYYKYIGAEQPLNYAYNAAAQLDKTSVFYKECTSLIGADPGKSVFVQVNLADVPEQQANYANWYSFYRTRMLMMKTSVGLAFTGVDAKYRVGFNSINNRTADPSHTDSGALTSFLDPKEFDINQKKLFYKDLYSTNPVYSTPLRGALSQAGQYYAHMAIGQKSDPVQYSCQKNFMILSTDGYWNTGGESTTAPKWGPYKLDNTTNVGQQDGSPTLRPMLDGDGSKVVTKNTWNVTNLTYTVTTKPVTRTWVSVNTIAYTKTITGNTRKVTTNVLPTNNNSVACTTYTVVGTAKSCLVTVSPASITGFTAGGKAIISSVVPAAFNGTFTIASVGTNSFTYTLTGLASNPGTATTKGKSVAGTNASGTTTVQTQTATSTQTFNATFTDTYTQIDNQTTSVPNTAVTPYTETITTVNGVVTADTIVKGATVTTKGTAVLSPLPDLSATATLKSAYSEVAVGNVLYGVWSTTATATAAYTNQVAGTSAITIPTPTPVATKPSPMPTALLSTTTQPTNPTSTATVQDPSYQDPNTLPKGAIGKQGAVTTVSTTTSGGSTDSLADVAMYYYSTDLRTADLGNCTGAMGSDVCFNNVGGTVADTAIRDNATWQHMTTYTLGLGNNGTLTYDPNYLTQVSGDYANVKNGTRNWPVPTGNATNIDDLWHAAVDGRGQYFSASEPNSLILGLKSALDSIKAVTGAASAAATSTLQPVQGDNDIYVAKFTSALWYGDVLSYKIDPDTGVVASVNDFTWSAQTELDKLVTGYGASSRKIWYAKPGATSLATAAFTYDNLDPTTQAYFNNFCSDVLKKGAGGTSHPLQCPFATTGNLGYANSGQNLVNYLRGDPTYANNSVFRSRDHLLGDIINASPLFVGQPGFRYNDSGYSSFAQTARTNVIYAAANDGMLHAFDRTSGAEKWAYIPTDVLPNLYKLADINYPSNHMYLVDGSPVEGDVYDSGQSKWRSILVAGLGAGGSSYYALDVTVPESPKLLWEYREKDLGLSFGNPIITKLSDGTWVVLLTSGYNNTNGDGNGHLYVLNALTGALLMKIDTNISGAAVGSKTTPSGLAKINNYVEADTDNTTKVVYGGDLLGNVWRFDINSLVKPYLSAMRLAQLKVGTTLQPIATKPSLAQIVYNGVSYKVLYVGTGEYLGLSDLTNTAKQTIYALKDNWDETGLGDVRAATNPAMVVQKATATVNATKDNIITGTALKVDWTNGIGWYLDLIGTGERVTVNPLIVLNALYVGTNVPNLDACSAGGNSWLYKLDISNGAALSSAPEGAIAVSLGNVLIVGMTNVQLTSKNVATVVTKSDGTVSTVIGTQPGTNGPVRKTSWRVLN